MNVNFRSIVGSCRRPLSVQQAANPGPDRAIGPVGVSVCPDNDL